MRIAYVTQTRFPTEKAHGNQIAQVCQAMAMLGHEVTLVSPQVGDAHTVDPGRYYGLRQKFTFESLPNFDALNAWFVPGMFAFSVAMRSYRQHVRVWLQQQSYDVLYARSPVVLPVLLETGVPVILELHTLPRRNKLRFVEQCNRCARVVALTSVMKKELIEWGVQSDRILVESDAVDLKRFAKLPTTAVAKKQFHLPADVPVIGYAGSLVTFDKVQKGVDILVEALVHLQKRGTDIHGFIVGGPAHWQQKYRTLAYDKGLTEADITFHDAVPAAHVPEALAACDVLVYPAPEPKHQFFKRDTSPLKLFEYLATGTPIVCADIPPIRDIVSKETVRLVQPGSISSLAGGIRDVLSKPKEASTRAKAGKTMVAHHSWEKRMERILTGVGVGSK